MIYLHNPNCSKSRQGLNLLAEHNVVVTVRDYLKDPLTKEELRLLFVKLKKEPSAVIRKKEAKILSINLSLTEDALLDAIAKHPSLLERPILIKEHLAIIGRPSELLLA